MILLASASDPSGLRDLRSKVREHLRLSLGNDLNADRLTRVLWELLTNLQHGTLDGDGVVRVEMDPDLKRVMILLPGPCFDSVSKASEPGARGLNTIVRQLALCSWRWTYRAVEGANEFCLEEESP